MSSGPGFATKTQPDKLLLGRLLQSDSLDVSVSLDKALAVDGRLAIFSFKQLNGDSFKAIAGLLKDTDKGYYTVKETKEPGKFELEVGVKDAPNGNVVLKATATVDAGAAEALNLVQSEGFFHVHLYPNEAKGVLDIAFESNRIMNGKGASAPGLRGGSNGKHTDGPQNYDPKTVRPMTKEDMAAYG